MIDVTVQFGTVKCRFGDVVLGYSNIHRLSSVVVLPTLCPRFKQKAVQVEAITFDFIAPN